MSDGRLGPALASGAVALPDEGRIAVLRPPEGYDLSALPRDRVTVVQGFRPAHDAFAALGYAVAVTMPEEAAVAVVVVPRAKAEAHALLERAARGGRPVIVDGLNTHGIAGLLKDLRTRATLSAPFSKAHGKIFALEAEPGALDDWRAPDEMHAGDWITAPGAFSADAPDPGSVALAEALPAHLSGRVADIGAGWGFLSAMILLDRPEIAALDVVEAEHAALEAARRNVTDPRARFHWADARTWGPAGGHDHVVSNPPFHVGRDADPGLGRAFIAAAARLLSPRGTFWMVANRHLPYEAALRERFRTVEPLPGPPAYKLVRCTGPIPAGVPQRRSRQRGP